jgi:diguanylate cyclase (GGDEF)-like protein
MTAIPMTFRNILIIFGILGVVLIILANIQKDRLIDERYQSFSLELKHRTDALIQNKSDSLMLIAMALAADKYLQSAITQDDPKGLDLDRFSKRLRKESHLKNLWFQIVKPDGTSFYRSWTDRRGDNLLKVRSELPELLETPAVHNTISVGKFDMTFKAMVPIYENELFIGYLEVIGKFNSIAVKLMEDNIRSVILVDDRYREQLTFPFTNRFIDDFYIANLNARPADIEFIKAAGLKHFTDRYDTPHVARFNDELVVHFTLPDEHGKKMASMIMMLPVTQVPLDDIYQTRNQIVLGLLVLLLISLGVAHNYYTSKMRASMVSLNKTLEDEVDRKTQELAQKSKFLQDVIDSVSDSIMVIDADFNVTLMNKTAQAYADAQFIERPDRPKCHELSHQQSHPCNGSDHPCPLTETLQTKEPVTMIHQHGDDFIELTTIPLFDNDGHIISVLEVGHNITNHINVQKKLEEQKQHLYFMAHHDSLTGLPNRTLFLDRLEQSIKHAHRHERNVGVMFIDLDRFKEINDSFGHETGDKLLVQVTRRFRELLRDVDTVARLGGDEFTMIFDEIENPDELSTVAQKIIRALQEPFTIDGNELHVTSSIGISIYPLDGSTSDLLLRNADSAMYRAKDMGKNTYEFYTSDMTEHAFERVLLENSLRNALKNSEFEVYYQPQIDARDESLLGFEALLRWHHPSMGMISPAKFIPIAEDTGIIVPIGRWVMKEVFTTVTSWIAQGHDPKLLSINLSPKQLETKDFIGFLKALLEETGCDATRIQFEITENLLMRNPDNAIKQLNEIRHTGFSLAIDDFGTGYSSLAYLKRFPIEKLKIDRSFIKDLPNDEEDGTIAKSIISLARNLKLSVIAEGVETIEQKDFLLKNGCHEIQGYLYSRPVPEDEARSFCS